MSRLRRLVLCDRWFFVTCRVLPRRRVLSEPEFACLARVIHQRRVEHRFFLTAWVFLPDHGHAIFYPAYPLTISTVREAIQDGATQRINRGRGERGILWQPRFFDRALRTVKEYNEKVQYIHLNPVKAGLVSRGEDWPWSSVHDYTGTVNDRPVMTVHAGACHLDWSDLLWALGAAGPSLKPLGNFALQVGQQLTNIMNTPGGPGCMGALAGAGAGAGGIGGAEAGLGGGPFAGLTIPTFSAGGAVAGAVAGVATAMSACPGGAASSGTGSGGKSDHAQERADEARAGDTHREVGDANRVIREGKQYTDSDTGYTIHVDGDRVVVTDANGTQVTQFINTRANTLQRIESGRWIPKP